MQNQTGNYPPVKKSYSTHHIPKFIAIPWFTAFGKAGLQPILLNFTLTNGCLNVCQGAYYLRIYSIFPTGYCPLASSFF
jgi:hypothetical protein